MMFSKARKSDIEARELMLEAMKISLRNGELGIAKEIGKSSEIMNEKITSKDYSQTDAFEEKILEVQRYFRKGDKEPKPWK